MVRFLVRRISLIMVTLLVVSAAIFTVTEILPGDAAKVILGQSATPEGLAALRLELGLERPAYVRYLDWISGVARGDWGTSYRQKLPITQVVGHRLENSLYLAVFAFFFGVPLAVFAGIWAGVRPNRLGDRVISTISLVGISLPEFVTGVLLIIVFSSFLHILPSSSIMMPGENPLTRPQVMVLPAITLIAVLFAYIMRMTRANVMEVMESHYVRTAILKGMPMRRVILRHVLPNSMLPTITIIAQNFGYMLGGLIIVENVFAYPGLGQLLLSAMQNRDVPLLEALALIIAGTYTLSNLVADVSYAALDPRIRVG
ncbi:MAG: ABC transporter permease [Chloroflexi bacterium]|nr:ABC transporter permease [Chloroflexota bacterium]